MSDRRTLEAGFTLVELMVVVLIIGILVAIAIPVFNAAKANAQTKSCYANQRTIEGAAQSYNASYGVLPTSGGAALVDTGLTQFVAVNGYIKSNPLCPTNRTKYNLATDGTVNGDNGGATWVHAHY